MLTKSYEVKKRLEDIGCRGGLKVLAASFSLRHFKFIRSEIVLYVVIWKRSLLEVLLGSCR